MSDNNNYYSLFRDEPFEELHIPCPKLLEKPEDYPQLLQHLVSVFRIPLNCYYRRYGLDARTELLTRMIILLDGMPELQPIDLRPELLDIDTIYEAVSALLYVELFGERKAG